jgi:hypothetical protein
VSNFQRSASTTGRETIRQKRVIGSAYELLTDFRFARRSLARVKGLAITVIVTLALGILRAERTTDLAGA